MSLSFACIPVLSLLWLLYFAHELSLFCDLTTVPSANPNYFNRG